MNAATTTTKPGTNSGVKPAAGAKPKRAPKPKLLVGADVVAQIEAYASKLEKAFGFKPSHGQAISALLRTTAERDASDAAAKATSAPSVSISDPALAANPAAKANVASWPGADKKA